jgi:hypothetical protein
MGKGVPDLDMIAVIANLCDVHFGHGDISLSEKAPPKSTGGRGAKEDTAYV